MTEGLTEGLTGKAEADDDDDGTVGVDGVSGVPGAPNAALVVMETVRWPRV